MTAYPGSYDPRDPFAGGSRSGQYDPDTFQALLLRAQRGDKNAQNFLRQQGFTDQDWAGGTNQQWAQTVQQWGTNAGFAPQQGGFALDPQWLTGPDATGFEQAWGDWFSGAGGRYDQQAQGPTPQALAGNQPGADTGADFAQQNFGYSYKQPGVYWNPWLMSERGEGFQGVYDPRADTARMDNGRGTGETMNSAQTVMRWTMDDLRNGHTLNGQRYADVGAAPLEVVQAEYLKNIARLHRDFDKNRWNWQTSGFAALQGGAPSTPPVGSGNGTPPSGGTSPSPTTYTNPETNQTVTSSSGDAGATLRNIALLNNPDQYLAKLMTQLGMDPTRQGLYTSSIAEALGPVAQAYSQLNGLYGDRNQIDTTEQGLNELAGTLRGPGAFGRINAQARGLLNDPRRNGLLNSLGDQQAINTMQTLLSQAFAGSNRIYNAARFNRFNQAFGPAGRFTMQALDQLGNPNFPRPVDWLNGTEFADLLSGY